MASGLSRTLSIIQILGWEDSIVHLVDWLDNRGIKVRFLVQAINILSTASKLTLGPKNLLYNEYGGDLSPEVKRPEHEVVHSLPSRAKFKNEWSYISTPPKVSIAWYMVKRRKVSVLFAVQLFKAYVTVWPTMLTGI